MQLETASQDIALVQMGVGELRQIAAGEPVETGMTVFAGALPPGHVATLALAEVDAGTPPFWCVPFLIVSKSRHAALGSCRFKTVPSRGEVEISYGVAPAQRGRGIGTAAIAQLLVLAASNDAVEYVVAHILPDNVASSRLAGRLGFVREREFTDLHGDTVVRWAWRAVSATTTAKAAGLPR